MRKSKPIRIPRHVREACNYPSYGGRDTATPEAYVKRFESLNHLVPTETRWVTPSLGNFG